MGKEIVHWIICKPVTKSFLDMFLTAKHLEGCSDKTTRYYRCNIEKMLEMIQCPVVKITTEMCFENILLSINQ